jgi:AcrR family transcriptional regulator
MPTEREPVRERIVAATLVSLARYGAAKTTLEDVAKEAGCARATVYRYFGGKQQLLDAVIVHECLRVLDAIDAAVEPEMSAEHALVAMAVTAAHEELEHDALQFVLAHEPELILPWITFDGCDRFLASTGAALAPTFAKFVPASEANRSAQWCTRIFLAHLGADNSPVTMTDAHDVRALVTDFVAPALAERRPERARSAKAGATQKIASASQHTGR